MMFYDVDCIHMAHVKVKDRTIMNMVKIRVSQKTNLDKLDDYQLRRTCYLREFSFLSEP
jgi:hypothetical protein